MCVSFLIVFFFQVYIIEVTDGEHKWKVKHRYSDFHDLHEKVREYCPETGAYFAYQSINVYKDH